MPQIADRPNADSLDAVLAQFDAKKEHFDDLGKRTRNLIEQLLKVEGIPVQSIHYRVKTRDKIASKYQDPAKNYFKLTEITDLIGFRIITYYEDDVDRAAEFICAQFVADPRSNDARVRPADSFGYHALNLVCSYPESRLALAENKAYAGDCFEIQITSILRHAWSEMEHSWYDLKDSFPEKIKRRYNRLAALIEIAEEEFRELRGQQREFRNSAAVEVKAGVPNLAIDPASLRAFIEQNGLVEMTDNGIVLGVLHETPGYAINERAMEMWAKLLHSAGLNTIGDVETSLVQNREAVVAYVLGCRQYSVAASPQGSQRPGVARDRGISLWYLGWMLIATEGEDKIREAMEQLGIHPPAPQDLRKQVAAAKFARSMGHPSMGRG